MGNQIIGGIITVATAIIGIAILAVLVSRNAQTSQVIGAAGKSFAGVLTAAVSPVTGGGGGGLLSPTSYGVGDNNYY